MNQFQNPYQPFQYRNPYSPPMTNPISQNIGMTWVQGIEGAKAQPINSNSIAVLFDSENDGRFYIKSSDNIGMCSLRYFDYKEVSNPQQTINTANVPDLSMYVTKEELKEILKGMVNTNEPIISTVTDSKQ